MAQLQGKTTLPMLFVSGFVATMMRGKRDATLTEPQPLMAK